MSGPAYTRLDNDERRRQLIAAGQEIFTRHAVDEVSMAQIAREAGISKALLYHYFPSKHDFFMAALATGADELRLAVEPAAGAAPLDALTSSLSGYLTWIDARPDTYRMLLQSAASVPEIRALVEQVRAETAQRILDGLQAEAPLARTAVRGWLGYMDSACLDWLEHRDISRDALRDLLLGTLLGTLLAAGVTLP